MGVRGLWEIVAPVARPVNLEGMGGQRLAIDASIWIYHFLKAMRDSDGKVVRHAHIIGFFRRICKLIFFGIKPVFVFDGGAPALKRATILNRKERRKTRQETAAATAAKILTLQLHKSLSKKKEEASFSSPSSLSAALGSQRNKGKIVTSTTNNESDSEVEVSYLDEINLDKDKRTNVKKVSLDEEFRRNASSDPYYLPEFSTEYVLHYICFCMNQY